MPDFSPYSIALGGTDYPSKYAGLLTFLDTVISPLTGRNKIINGKMEIAQRGTSFAAIAQASSTYTLDRFAWYYQNMTGVVTVSQQSDVPSSNEFQNSLRVAVTTADTSIGSAELATLYHIVEGFNVRDLIGRTFSLSFWVRSSKTGTHCIALTNSGTNRSYVAEYSISAANTWEYKTITVSGGLITAGTWNWTNGVGLAIRWTLAAGTTFQTTAGAWQTGDFSATSNQVNCLDSTSNIFAITGVQLEVGSVATPFEHRPIGVERMLCERYLPAFNGNGFVGSSWMNSATSGTALYVFKVTPRVPPTGISASAASTFTNSSANVNTVLTGITFNLAANDICSMTLTVAGTANAGGGLYGNAAASQILFTGCEL